MLWCTLMTSCCWFLSVYMSTSQGSGSVPACWVWGPDESPSLFHKGLNLAGPCVGFLVNIAFSFSGSFALAAVQLLAGVGAAPSDSAVTQAVVWELELCLCGFSTEQDVAFVAIITGGCRPCLLFAACCITGFLQAFHGSVS